jgi:type II secretory pathway pseudopilin PulG
MITILLRKRAMTLLEIVITVMLISIVIGAGIMPFVMQQGMLRTHMARSDIQDQVSIAMAYINKDVFRATQISFPDTGDDFIITLGISTNLQRGVNQNITYSLNNTSLQRTVDSGNANTIANNITDFTVSNIGNNYIEVTITARRDDQDLTSSTAFALRATRA